MADEKIIFSMVGVSKTFTNQKKVLNSPKPSAKAWSKP